MTIPRILLSIAGFAAVIYLLFALTLYAMQDRLVFLPPPVNAKVYEPWRGQAFQLELNGRQLHGWKIPGGADNNRFIIYFGGNAEDVVYNLYDGNRFRASHIFSVNYAGYGNSEGEPSQQILLQDALAVFDYAREHFQAESNRIYVMGRSVGSSVASYVAANRRAAGLILVTPFDSVENVAAHYYPWLPVRWLLKHPFPTVDYIHQVQDPILVLSAGQDEIIPPGNLNNLLSAAPDDIEHFIIKQANHQNISAYKSYFQHINHFIQSHEAAR